MKVRVLILVLAVVLRFSSARANLLQNGSFETYAKAPSTWSTPNIVDFYLDIGNTDITGWTVIKGEIDYLAYSAYTWQAADGERCLDLCGNPGSGGLSQSFPTETGMTYEVQFHMSANPMTGYSGDDQQNKTLRVQAAGQFADFSYDRAVEQNSFEDMKWKLCTFTFIADSNSTTLEIFSTMDIIKIGPVIDNVSVVSMPVYSLTGTYTGTNIMGEHLLTTIVPMDMSDTRFTIVSDVINPGTSRTTARGQIVKIGFNTYAATQVAYITDETYNLTSKVVVSGTIVQKSDDNLEAVWAAAVYGPDQDPFLEGAMPLLCLPDVVASYQRVPIVAPCEPSEMP
jgi:choice-of-anchor C domain-containing protein